MRILSVKASKPYEVIICEDYSLLASKLKGVVKGKIAVVFDENTARYFSNDTTKALADIPHKSIVISAGEQSKRGQCYFKILSFFIKSPLNFFQWSFPLDLIIYIFSAITHHLPLI